MLKFWNYDIVFAEVPDHTTLAVNLTGCPLRCPGCHSPHLREDVGDPLDHDALAALLARYGSRVTCVALMGGDAALRRGRACCARDTAAVPCAGRGVVLGAGCFARSYRPPLVRLYKVGRLGRVAGRSCIRDYQPAHVPHTPGRHGGGHHSAFSAVEPPYCLLQSRTRKMKPPRRMLRRAASPKVIDAAWAA